MFGIEIHSVVFSLGFNLLVLLEGGRVIRDNSPFLLYSFINDINI